MLLIGMTGPIGHGKTTFAEALANKISKYQHFESSLIIAEVADAMHAAITELPDPYDVDSLNRWLMALPAILEKTVHTTANFDQLRLVQSDIEQHPVEYQKLILHVENLARQPSLRNQKITRENKENYRPFLQWLGGYLVKKVDVGIWYKELVRRIELVKQSGCELCIVGGLRYPTDAAILRQAGGIIVKVYRPGHLQNDMLDPTERERENIEVDCTIMSNGSIDDVKRCAETFLEDLKANRLQPIYQTKNSVPISNS